MAAAGLLVTRLLLRILGPRVKWPRRRPGGQSRDERLRAGGRGRWIEKKPRKKKEKEKEKEEMRGRLHRKDTYTLVYGGSTVYMFSLPFLRW